MRAKLIGSAGPLAGREFTLDAPVTTLGRRDENDIVIKDPTISRKHAEIRQDGDDLILRDNGSTSGTMVNGAPLTGEHRLRDGDTIIIGSNATFTVQMHPDDSATVAFSREAFMPPTPGQTPGTREPGGGRAPAPSEHPEPQVAPHWENAPASAHQAPSEQPWGSPPPRHNAEPPTAPDWAAQPPPASGQPGAQWGAPPAPDAPGAATWGQAPPSGPPTAPAADWGGPPAGQLNFPHDQAAGGTMVGGPGMGPPQRHENPPRPSFNTPPPGISGPPPGFGPPPGGMPGQQGFGMPPGQPGGQPGFGPPPSPGGYGQPGTMPPRPPQAAARKRGRGPLVAVLLILLLVIIIAVVVVVLVLRSGSTAGIVAPLAMTITPFARAVAGLAL